MVHRKSTYKLMFKNVKADTRKSIWQENSVFREQRKKDEMAHHSIDEEDIWCECDNESLASYEERTCDVSKKTSCQSQPDEPDNVKVLPSEQQQTEKSENMVSNPSKNVWKLPLTFNRGVLKLSPSTGELDLIPAESQSNKKLDSRHRAASCSRFPSSYGIESFVNIRPRTQTKYVPTRTNRPQSAFLTSTTCIPRTRSSDAIFLKEDGPFRSDKILLSSRRTPRIHGRKSTVCCSNCGKCL